MTKTMMKMLCAAGLLLAAGLARAELAEYVDEGGEIRTNTTFSVVTAATAQLTNGWYLVEGTVRRGEIDVAAGCTAHLILADGASLTVLGGFRKAGIDVSSGEELVIYGQRDGTGRLSVNGGAYAAGIGGYSKAVGRIRICGGTVTAEGGQYGAGIGCGYAGLGGEVVISGGRVNAIAGRSASCVGRGLPQESACSVAISGGVFAHEPEVDWLADGYGVFANPDPTTCADYPYAVLSYKTRENWRIR